MSAVVFICITWVYSQLHLPARLLFLSGRSPLLSLSPSPPSVTNVWESRSLLTFSKCSQQRFLSSAAELFRTNRAMMVSVRAG